MCVGLPGRRSAAGRMIFFRNPLDYPFASSQKEQKPIQYILCSFFRLCKRILRQAQDKIPKEKHTGNDLQPYSQHVNYITNSYKHVTVIAINRYIFKHDTKDQKTIWCMDGYSSCNCSGKSNCRY